jgi:tetratricopeptide (TPR) repeat protein
MNRVRFLNRQSTVLQTAACLVSVVGSLVLGSTFLGCKQELVYQRPVSDLNNKAEQLIQQGDYAGALSRLEAAHDLQPKDAKTTQNLATAHQMNGHYDQAIALLTGLIENPDLKQANVYKLLGITYEAKADALLNEAEKQPDVSSGTAASSEPEALLPEAKQQAAEAYELAIEYYNKAIPGVERADVLKHQIEVLHEQLAKLKKTDMPAS